MASYDLGCGPGGGSNTQDIFKVSREILVVSNHVGMAVIGPVSFFKKINLEKQFSIAYLPSL